MNQDKGRSILLASQRERSLERAYQQLWNSSLSQMVSGVAHEINNPLAILNGLSAKLGFLAERGTVSQSEVEDAGRRISTTVNRIARTVNALRTIARDGAAEPFRPVTVGDMFNDAVLICQERFRNYAITLKVFLPDEPVQIEGRRGELSLAFLQLLQGAFDAVQMPSNPAQWWIDVQVVDGPEKIEVLFTHNGPRPAPEARAGVHGLGLALCQKAIEAHRGRLFMNEASAHTQLVVSLPKRQPAAAPSIAAPALGAAA